MVDAPEGVAGGDGQAADVVLANPPPYKSLPWLGMGLPLIATWLEGEGIRSRIVRFLDDAFSTPEPVAQASWAVMSDDPAIADRLSEARLLWDEHADFFESLLSRLLAGPERVFGFSAWRINANVVLELTRRLKERRPDAFVVIGGPEATAAHEDFHQPWIDVVMVNGAEGAIGSVFRALIDGQPAAVGRWDKVWLNPRHPAPLRLVRQRAEMPPMTPIDFSKVIPLFFEDSYPVLPVLLNVGCPFRCSFCTNTTIYPKLEWGTPERLLQEMLQISALWRQAFDAGKIPGKDIPKLRFMLCDATVNAQPEQFEQLCELMAAAEWPAPYTAEGMIVMSSRITPRRVELAIAAGFDFFFFGLETASRRLRGIVKKPGTVESIAKAIEVFDAAGKGVLHIEVGVIVGWPGETEEEFYETIRFLDWAVTKDVVRGLGVTPMMRTPAAMDLGPLTDSEGKAHGLYWRLPGPAGTPDARARRTLHVLEHFGGVIQVRMGVEREDLMRMLESPARDFWNRWDAVHAGEDRVPPRVELQGSRRAAPTLTEDPPGVPTNSLVKELRRSLAPTLADRLGPRWTVQRIVDGPRIDSAIIGLVAASDALLVALLLEKRGTGDAYARTGRFNVSYLPYFDGTTGTFEKGLIDSVVAFVAEHEQTLALPWDVAAVEARRPAASANG